MSIGYTTVGHGKEIVIVMHGWLLSASIFEPVFPGLDTEKFTYVFVDFRGCGKSLDIVGQYRLEECCDDIHKLCQQKNWSVVHLVGHSMGALVLQKILADNKLTVKSAVAITPVPASGYPQDAEGDAFFKACRDNDENRYFIFDFASGNRLSRNWLNWLVSYSNKHTVQVAVPAYYDAWSKADFVDAIDGNTTPLLILVGEHDSAITAATMEETCLKWFPESRMEVIANAGHYPMQEAPVCLATMIEAHLNEYCA